MKSNAKPDLDYRIDRARLSRAMQSHTPAEDSQTQLDDFLREIGYIE
jgi:hypothetical protein